MKKAEEKAKPFPFKISPDSLQNVKEVREPAMSYLLMLVSAAQSSKKKIPEFLFEGFLTNTNCNLLRPMTGGVDSSSALESLTALLLQS